MGQQWYRGTERFSGNSKVASLIPGSALLSVTVPLIKTPNPRSAPDELDVTMLLTLSLVYECVNEVVNVRQYCPLTL